MGSIPLDVGAAVPPDGSASNLAAAIQRVKSSGSAPGVYFLQAAYDATNVEWLTWSGRMPSDYTGSPVFKGQYKMASATSNGIALDCRLCAVTPGDSTDFDAEVFGSANVGTDTVPGTAGHVKEVTINLSNADSLAAGDRYVVYLGRATGDGGDTASGDLEFVGGSIEYS